MTDTGLPHLPGVATVSQILSAFKAEYTELKFLPTQAAQTPSSRSDSPIRSARVWSTGEISTTNAAQYLALPNVGLHGFHRGEGLRGRRIQGCGETAEPGVVRTAS
jgi:2-dehydro-3-deoxyphosphogluconate aldolase/(4S)-4-hydroxy-2-oxoglutarate aldolase